MSWVLGSKAFSTGTQALRSTPDPRPPTPSKQMKKAKNARSARYLKKQLPQAKEDAKKALFIRGLKTNETIMALLKDLNQLKKPHSIMFSRKNEVRPFEDISNVEFLCNKNNAAFFILANHSKKRPHNLTIGRVFNESMLDMIEFGVDNYKPISSFKHKFLPGGKPCFIFEGAEFSQEEPYQTVQSLFLDMFRGETVERINLTGLDRVCVLSVIDKVIYVRHYTTQYLQSGSNAPRLELLPTGPNFTLKVRRTQFANQTVLRQALRKVKTTQPKRVKNIARDVFGEKVGRLHVEKQDLDKIQTRKVKALKKRKRGNDDANDEK